MLVPALRRLQPEKNAAPGAQPVGAPPAMPPPVFNFSLFTSYFLLITLPFGSQSRQPVAAPRRRAARCSRALSPATACRNKSDRSHFRFSIPAPSSRLFVSLALPKILSLGRTKLTFASALDFLVSLTSPKILRLGKNASELAFFARLIRIFALPDRGGAVRLPPPRGKLIL